MANLTHDDLVKRAADWLYGRHKCVIVAVEQRCWASVVWPDALGWTYRGFSVLVEAKVSVSDFYSDAKKRRKLPPDLFPGRQRYYLTPPGLLRGRTLPDGWGLAEAHPKQVRIVTKATTFSPTCHQAELPLLISACRGDV